MHSNDPKTPEFDLSIEGEVAQFASISPSHLRLYGKVGEDIAGEAVITPTEQYPFKIVETNAQKGEHINITLKEHKAGESPGYTLVVENKMKEAGRYYDVVELKTDSNVKKVLTVKVYGNVVEPDAPKQQ